MPRERRTTTPDSPETLPVWRSPVPAALAELLKLLELHQQSNVAGYYFSLFRPGRNDDQPDTVSYGLLHRTRQGELQAFKHESIVGLEPELFCDEDIDPRNSNVSGTAADVMTDIGRYFEQGFCLANQLGCLRRSDSYAGAVYAPLVATE